VLYTDFWQLWCQLGLLTSVAYHTRDGINCQAPHFSIEINYEHQDLDFLASSPGLLEERDVSPPSIVPCASMQVIRTRFDFATITENPSHPKNEPQFDTRSLSVPNMDFLDPGRGEYEEVESFSIFPMTPPYSVAKPIPVLKAPEVLQTTVQNMSATLSATISQFFHPPKLSAKPKLKSLIVKLPVSLQVYQRPQNPTTESLQPRKQQVESPIRKTRTEKIAILSAWIELHSNNPYPTQAENKVLMRETGYAKGTPSLISFVTD
jgi:hypothetical protein